MASSKSLESKLYQGRHRTNCDQFRTGTHPFISRRDLISYQTDGETVNKLVYLLLIYGILSLILTILVNDEILYVPIDAVVSLWSYIFFVFNPVPVLYRSALILITGPSVWINSSTMTAILFVYPIIVMVLSLILFYKYRGFVRRKK
ncbi:MAG TPA: hypothetical protein VMT06_02385 [Candidatus Eisenbacteria bacterium]|nr:hypothetical protein [Candidatus Eisenbacteria bacterium]